MGGGLPEAVEAVVRRGLAADRDDRYPDVPAFVAALTAALDESFAGADEAPTAWIPPDPSLTQLAPDPLASAEEPTSDERPSTRRRWAMVGAAALVVGLLGGYVLQRVTTTEQQLVDALQTISVTVPERWTAAVDEDPWVPPDATDEFPSLSAGTGLGWNGDEEPGHGVFVGLMRGDDLPTRMPQHPECVDPPAVDGPRRAGRRRRPHRHVHRVRARRSRRRGHRGAGRARDRQPAAVGAGARRGPRHRQPGARLGRALRDVAQSSRRRARSASRCCSVSKRQGDWNAR